MPRFSSKVIWDYTTDIISSIQKHAVKWLPWSLPWLMHELEWIQPVNVSSASPAYPDTESDSESYLLS